MPNRYRTRLSALALALGATASMGAAAQDSYRIAWTIYAGSMPLGYAEEAGILKKWGDKYGFDLEAVQMNDYIEAQTQFAAGEFDGAIAITLDALTIPAGSGVDTTAVVPLSTSSGSDGIVMRGKDKTIEDLKGERVNLVELSGSHYMLARALDKAGMSEKDVTVVNTSDADIASSFEDPSTQVVSTWKPQLTEILEQYPDSTLVFDSSDIHGEIVDALVVQTDKLEKNPNLGKAISGAWYEVMEMMQPDHPQHEELMDYMASELNTNEKGLASQLETIDFFSAEEARELVTSDEYEAKLKAMTTFAFQHGLLGDNVPNEGYIGIETGDGDIIGNAENVKLRFPTTWIEQP